MQISFESEIELKVKGIYGHVCVCTQAKTCKKIKRNIFGNAAVLLN